MRVEVDPTGKRNGRGAYLCRRRSCWQRAIDGNALARALKTDIDDETKAELREYARSHFPPDENLSPEPAVIAAPGGAPAIEKEEDE
jgi:predicted RNA-binding protein YlxR (DUF448 family)